MKTIKQRKYWLEHCNDEKYVVMRNTITEAFKDLIFDEKPHKYYLHGEELTCVSDITHLFVPHFDSDMMAAMTAKRNYNNPNSKYYQMTSKMIKESWKNISSEACYKGTQRHNFGESVFWWMVGQYDKIVPEFNDRFTVNEDGERICTAQHMKEEAILQFWDDLPDCYIPILAENKVFNVNDTYKYSGTFDILFYYDAPLNGKDDKYSGFAILDYKGLPLDTPILTTKGWKVLNDVTTDDVIFDGNGKQTRILNISNVHDNPCYKIRLDNAEEIISDEDHRWEITFIERDRGINHEKIKVLTTKQLYNLTKDLNRKDLRQIPRIKVSSCIEEHTDVEQLIDPYVLGVWLGDGHSACGMVTNMYDAIFEEVENRGYKVGDDVSQGGAGKAKSRTILGLSPQLRKYNLLNNKHVPYEYLIGPYESRFQVLQGIMDTDGYYNPARKRYVLATTKNSQAEFCIRLLSSLGIKCSRLKCKKYCNGKKIDGFDVCFYSERYPFLVRKIDVGVPGRLFRTKYYTIKSVEKCETVKTKCIEVESDTHTFIFGNHFIKTHNTNMDLYKNFNGQKMLEPFDDFLNMSVSVYKLQLAAYQLCLEKIGLKVIARRLIWLKHNGTYEKVILENLTKRLDKALRYKFKNK